MKPISEFTDAELRHCKAWSVWENLLAAEVIRLRGERNGYRVSWLRQEARAEKAEAELATTNHATSMNWMHRVCEQSVSVLLEEQLEKSKLAVENEELRTELAAARAESASRKAQVIEYGKSLEIQRHNIAQLRLTVARQRPVIDAAAAVRYGPNDPNVSRYDLIEELCDAVDAYRAEVPNDADLRGNRGRNGVRAVLVGDVMSDHVCFFVKLKDGPCNPPKCVTCGAYSD